MLRLFSVSRESRKSLGTKKGVFLINFGLAKGGRPAMRVRLVYESGALAAPPMDKTTLTRMGNRGLTCLEWGLRGGSVILAVLIPALVRPEKDLWVAAGAAGFCVGACQGLLLLAGRARKAKAVQASEAICARLEERINNDLAVIL